MAKTIIPHKLIIDLDTKEDLKYAVLLYQTNTDGNISKMMSVSVKSGIKIADIKNLIKDAKTSTKTSEGS